VSLVKLTVQGTDEAGPGARRRDGGGVRRSLPAQAAVVGPFAAPVAKISDVFRCIS
jgi:hypothetical protein